MTSDPFAQPVEPTNTGGRGRTKRRDPDDTPQTAAADTTPSAAAPTTQVHGYAAADLDHTAPPAGGTLGPVLAPTTGTGTGDTTTGTGVHDSVSVLVGLARMRQQITDPFTDYVTDGTRTLRFVQQAIHQVAHLTGRTRQDVQTRALLGIEALPDDVLEANFQAIYGYPRAQYQHGNHR